MNKMSKKDRKIVADNIVRETIREIDEGTIKWLEMMQSMVIEDMKRAGVIVVTEDIDLD